MAAPAIPPSALTQAAINAAGVTAPDPVERRRQRFAAFNYVGGPMGLVTKRGRVVASGTDGRYAPGKWTNLGAGSINRITRGNRDVMQITGPSTGTVQIRAARAIPTTAFQKLGIWIETPNVTAGNYTILVWYSPDVPSADPPTADPVNRRTLSLAVGDIMNGSRQMIGVDRTGRLYRAEAPGIQSVGQPWVDVGTISDASKISQLSITLVCDANVPADQRWLNIDTVELDSYAVPLVMLGFDGTLDPVVRDLFASRGIPWYNAKDGEALLDGTAFLDDFIARGNEIVCNGRYHTDYGLNASTLADDIDYCRSVYAARGWPQFNTFAYPFNSRSAASDAVLIAKGFGLARSYKHAPISYSQNGVPLTTPTPGNSNPSIINIGSFGCDQQTAVTMNGWVDDAILTGHGFNALAHALTTSTTPGSVQTNLSEYTTFLNYCQAKHEAGLIRLCLPREAQALLGA